MSEQPTRAVQYLRMSTEHQRYSLESQAAAIAVFALAHGYRIEDTYVDPGKSGLTLKGRPALLQLLSDVTKPDRGFSAVLVLDVSRWGRFQDPDEAAHYEFICRKSGAPVVYCNEPFQGDLSFAGAILKQLKRVMAGEYSRELSAKVLFAQLRQAGLGFKQGGPRGYGTERLLIDKEGRRRMVLRRGQGKLLHEDRVVPIRASAEEAEVVRLIFRLYVSKQLSLVALAHELNARFIPAADGGEWTAPRVKCVLKSEFAIGNYVFNRRSRPMKSDRTRVNPPEAWVRVHVMEPIVSQRVFDAAQARLAARAQRLGPTQEEILKPLARLLRKEGRLSMPLIAQCPYTPRPETVRKRFGSLAAAYERLGYRGRLRWAFLSDAEIGQLLRDLNERVGFVTERMLATSSEVPSVSYLQVRFGSLMRAYEVAGLPSTLPEVQRAGWARRNAGKVLAARRPQRRRYMAWKFSDEHLIAGLQRLAEVHGKATAQLVRDDPLLPMVAVYSNRFGSLLKAYELAGLPHTRKEIWTRASREARGTADSAGGVERREQGDSAVRRPNSEWASAVAPTGCYRKPVRTRLRRC